MVDIGLSKRNYLHVIYYNSNNILPKYLTLNRNGKTHMVFTISINLMRMTTSNVSYNCIIEYNIHVKNTSIIQKKIPNRYNCFGQSL